MMPTVAIHILLSMSHSNRRAFIFENSKWGNRNDINSTNLLFSQLFSPYGNCVHLSLLTRDNGHIRHINGTHNYCRVMLCVGRTSSLSSICHAIIQFNFDTLSQTLLKIVLSKNVNASQCTHGRHMDSVSFGTTN